MQQFHLLTAETCLYLHFRIRPTRVRWDCCWQYLLLLCFVFVRCFVSAVRAEFCSLCGETKWVHDARQVLSQLTFQVLSVGGGGGYEMFEGTQGRKAAGKPGKENAPELLRGGRGLASIIPPRFRFPVAFQNIGSNGLLQFLLSSYKAFAPLCVLSHCEEST